MPYPPQHYPTKIHDDDTHEGSAKRNVASGLAGLDASSLVDSSQLTALFGLTRMAMGIFTRNTADADGSQQITGTNFQPKLVIFLSVVSSTAAESKGVSDGTNSRVISNINPTTADSYIYNASYCISVNTANGVFSSAYVDSLDSNGFTLEWVKEGSPSGTVTTIYIALR